MSKAIRDFRPHGLTLWLLEKKLHELLILALLPLFPTCPFPLWRQRTIWRQWQMSVPTSCHSRGGPESPGCHPHGQTGNVISLDSQNATGEGILKRARQQRQGGPETEVTLLQVSRSWGWHQSTGCPPLCPIVFLPFIHSSGSLFTQQAFVEWPVCTRHVQRISCHPTHKYAGLGQQRL